MDRVPAFVRTPLLGCSVFFNSLALEPYFRDSLRQRHAIYLWIQGSLNPRVAVSRYEPFLFTLRDTSKSREQLANRNRTEHVSRSANSSVSSLLSFRVTRGRLLPSPQVHSLRMVPSPSDQMPPFFDNTNRLPSFASAKPQNLSSIVHRGVFFVVSIKIIEAAAVGRLGRAAGRHSPTRVVGHAAALLIEY